VVVRIVDEDVLLPLSTANVPVVWTSWGKKRGAEEKKRRKKKREKKKKGEEEKREIPDPAGVEVS